MDGIDNRDDNSSGDTMKSDIVPDFMKDIDSLELEEEE